MGRIVMSLASLAMNWGNKKSPVPSRKTQSRANRWGTNVVVRGLFSSIDLLCLKLL
jgi:hypothetical protein